MPRFLGTAELIAGFDLCRPFTVTRYPPIKRAISQVPTNLAAILQIVVSTPFHASQTSPKTDLPPTL